MKLYFKPGACSLASHIALREAGAEFETEQVDTASGRTASGGEFRRINPKGYVPTLVLDDGAVLTEGAAILQFIADAAPAARLAPAAGSFARVRLQEHLNFIASELHKAFGPFFAETPPEGAPREAALARLDAKLDLAEAALEGAGDYLLGEDFSVADAYLFVVAGWTGPTGIGLGERPRLRAFIDRVASRPAVTGAMRAEGLLQ